MKIYYFLIQSDIMKGRNVIVTGGAGFIGSNLVEELAKENNVLVIDNLHTGSTKNLEEAMKTGNVKFVNDDSKNINNYGFDADYVFHIGIYSSSPMYKENPMLVGEVVSGITSVLEYAKKKNAKLVFASSSSIYNGIKPPHKEDAIPLVTDYYTEARIACERLAELYAKLHGIDVSAMRFFSVYGKHEESKGRYANLATQFLRSMKKGEPPVIYGDGSQKRDFVFVSDVVEAMLKAAEKNSGFNIYNVGTGRNHDINTLVEKINNLLGKDIKPRYVEMPMKNYVYETLADTKKSEEKLGFKASIDLDKGLELINQYYGV